jgi:hypothetical protein
MYMGLLILLLFEFSMNFVLITKGEKDFVHLSSAGIVENS